MGRKWSLAWQEECIKWRGRVLDGPYGHWCSEWDELPVDMWTPEFNCCHCYKGVVFKIAKWMSRKYINYVQNRQLALNKESPK